MYDELYENASTFIHHPLYHPGSFELSCNNDAGLNSTIQWIFSPLDGNSEIIIDQSALPVTQNITIDGMIVPVSFQATVQSSSVVTLRVSQVVPGNFVCQSNNFSLLLRVVTGMQCIITNANYIVYWYVYSTIFCYTYTCILYVYVTRHEKMGINLTTFFEFKIK